LDLSGFDLDGPFPRHLIDTSGPRGVASRFQLVIDIVDREKPTIRQLVQRLAGARGHFVLAGTPEEIADHIQGWFEGGAADGFNIMPPWLTGGFDAFAEHVVPILRRRGLFR
ncbi:nitrilotriacetate monooxygenase, partial [Klebsiella pneumoniae]